MSYIETEKVELKRVLNDSFEKEVVAFLNSHDGTVYIGVDDDGTIIGVNNVDKLMKEISDLITDKILPDCKNFVHPSAIYEEGKRIIKVEVNKGNSLYYNKKFGRSASGCYIRIGTTCKSMSEDEINTRFAAGVAIPRYSLIDEISPRQDLTFRILKIYLDTYSVNYNDENFALNNHLLTKNGKYNYQAFILSDQNDLSYKIAQWEGTTKKSKYLFKKEFGNCSVLKAIDDLNPIFNPHIILSDRFLMMEKLPEEMNI